MVNNSTNITTTDNHLSPQNNVLFEIFKCLSHKILTLSSTDTTR